MKNKICGKNYINLSSVMLFLVLTGSVVTKPAMNTIARGSNRFRDFLVGLPAYYGTNKTGEWAFFWGILLAGMFLAFFLSFFDHTDTREGQKISRLSYSCMALCPMLLQLLIYGQTAPCFAVISVLFFLVIFVYQQNALIKLAAFIKIYFAVWAVSVFLSVVMREYRLGDNKVLAVSMFLFLVLCVVPTYETKIVSRQKENVKINSLRKYRERSAYYINLSLQMLHPFLLLIYLKNDYHYNGRVIELPYHKTYVIIIGILILSLLLSNVYRIWQDKKCGRNGIQNRTFFATVFSVFAFVSYMSPAMIMQTDLHHHGEQILAFQQIAELGQKVYEDYYPASGLFPMIIGAINSLLFDKAAISYGMSYVLTALAFELFIMYLLYRRVGGHLAVCIALIFHMPIYCRTWILLPALLILFDRSLFGKNAVWLFVWVLICYGCGLYYPLFGAGILLATLPAGAAKLVFYIRNREWKKRDLLLAGILCLLILPAIPLLIRMLGHILSMGSQTINVDGISVWDSKLPDWFMPYLTGWKERETIYHIVRLLLGCVFVWLFAYLCGRYISVKKCRDKHTWKQILSQSGLFILFSIPILLCVCYSYTMVCMDEDWVGNLLSRSDHVILWICGIWGFIVIHEFGDEILKKKQKVLLGMMLLCVPFLFFVRCEDYHFPALEGTTDSKSFVVGEYDTKLKPFAVREGQLLVTPDLEKKYEFVEFDRIGKGFIYDSVLEKLNRYEAVMTILRGYDPEIQLLGFEESQFYYYLMNEKCVYSGRTAIAKSREASEVVIQKTDIDHTAVRSGVTPLEQYYLYHYFEKAGYQYAPDLDVFIPQKLYRTIYGKEGTKADSVWTNPYDCMYVADAYGKSVAYMENLKQVYSTCKGVAQKSAADENVLIISLSEPVSGSNADFIYLEFEDAIDCKATITFTNEEPLEGSCTLHFSVGDGRLLIPVGINANWLDGTHDSLTVTFENANAANHPVLKEIKFYELIQDE